MILRISIIFLCIVAVAYPYAFRQDSSVIQEVEEYIENKRPEIDPRYRLHYHVIPPVGWMNDPNGFSFYKGQYHLFYQFYPYDSIWGPMHWGHVTSSNLVDWETQPTALVPDEEMCFSGSAVVDGDRLVLIYTGRVIIDEEPLYNETQYLAFSDDGINFVKYEGNPVLTSTPNGAHDFRDPKAWKHEDYWYVVIGSQTDDNRGRALLYRSADLINWEFLNVLAESSGDLGYMWECPDFFELDGKFVLLWSPQGMEPKGDRYKNIYQTGYILGNFSYETFEFTQETSFQEIDYGHDFYASQTTEVDGKRYLLAWFNTWEKEHYPEAEDGWMGAMTIVRELSIIGDRVLMKPVDEMVSLRDENIALLGNLVAGELHPGDVIEFGQTGEIIIQLNMGEEVELLITGQNGGDEVLLKWDPTVKKVVVDRSGDVRQVEWSPISPISWRLFLDASSLELFCGEGEVVFSTRAYPNGDWLLTNRSPQVLLAEAYKLKRSV